jgi:hypothetical protein
MRTSIIGACGCMVLAGCAARSGDPFAPVESRLAARASQQQSQMVADANRRSDAPRATAPSSLDDSFTSFTLSSNPTLDSSIREPQLAGRTADPQSGVTEETTLVTVGDDVGRRRAPLPGFWDTLKRDVQSMPADLWSDTKAVYGSAPNLIILGLSYGGSLAVQETGPDNTVEDYYRHHHTFSKGTRDTFGALGNPATHFALAGAWYLLGQQRQDEKTYNVGRTLFSALIINGVSTLALQTATWDDAPNGEWGSFASGHTSSAFTLASVMHEAYGPLVGAPLYGLGVLVAIERLDDNEHYLSDVLMGGVMGLVIGHTVAGQHEFKLFGGEVLPYADPNTGSSGVAWVKHFK